jgi:hypothetical protein
MSIEFHIFTEAEKADLLTILSPKITRYAQDMFVGFTSPHVGAIVAAGLEAVEAAHQVPKRVSVQDSVFSITRSHMNAAWVELRSPPKPIFALSTSQKESMLRATGAIFLNDSPTVKHPPSPLLAVVAEHRPADEGVRYSLYFTFPGSDPLLAGCCKGNVSTAIARARKIVEAFRAVGIWEFMVEVVRPEVEQTPNSDAYRVPFRYRQTVRQLQPVAAQAHCWRTGWLVSPSH